MKILLIEDNQDIAESLKLLLENENYQVNIAYNKKESINLISQDKYDFYILDISLPDGNGFDLFEEKIKKLNKPTIFLTAKDEEENIVKGLEIGAEDYITKPFSSRELLVRINKILSRYKKNNIITIKDIKVDTDKLIVYKNEEKINLTSLEMKILILLITHLDKVVTRDSIIEHIWEWTGNDVNDNTITVYLKRIREKLNSDIIVTIKGIGYRIDSDEK